MGSLWGNKANKREMVHPVMAVTMILSLCGHLTSTQFGSTLAMGLYARVVARGSRPTTASADARSFFVASLAAGKYFATFPCGARGEEEKRMVLSRSRKREDHVNWKTII